MTLQYIDPMDAVGAFVPHSGVIDPVPGRNGGTALQTYGGSSNRMRIDFVPNGITPSDYITLGVAMYVQSPAYSGGIYTPIAFTTTTNPEAQLLFNPGGVLTAARYNQQALLASAAGVWPLNRWFYVEIQYRCHDTLGVFKVWVDGVQVINVTSGDTKNSTNPIIDQVIFESYQHWVQWDDFYICTGSAGADAPFGDSVVETLVPNGNGDVSQWAGSDGNSVDNYALVDEMPASATDYIQSGVVGQQDLYAVSDLVLTTGTVHAVAPTIYASKDEVGPRTIKPVFKRGITSVGTGLSLDFAYANRSAIYTVDPSTGLAWTQPNINATQYGVEVG